MPRNEQQRKTMGARIRRSRELAGLKQQTVADEVGVSIRTYQSWQEGLRTPSESHLARLAELFGTTPAYILVGDTREDILVARIEELEKRNRATEARLADVERQAHALHDLFEDALLRRLEELADLELSNTSSPRRRATGRSRGN